MLIRTVGPFRFVPESSEAIPDSIYDTFDEWKYRTLYLCADRLEDYFPKIDRDRALRIEIYDMPAVDRLMVERTDWSSSRFYISRNYNCVPMWNVIGQYCKRNLPETFYVRVTQS